MTVTLSKEQAKHVTDRLRDVIAEALSKELAELPTGWTRYEVSLVLEPRDDGSVGVASGKHNLWHGRRGMTGGIFAECDMLIDDGDAGPNDP
jgi:hypothetical protein